MINFTRDEAEVIISSKVSKSVRMIHRVTLVRGETAKCVSTPSSLVRTSHSRMKVNASSIERRISLDSEFLPLWITLNARVNFLLLDLARVGASDPSENSATVCNVLINFIIRIFSSLSLVNSTLVSRRFVRLNLWVSSERKYVSQKVLEILRH